jgi:hypothetical protein
VKAFQNTLSETSNRRARSAGFQPRPTRNSTHGFGTSKQRAKRFASASNGTPSSTSASGASEDALVASATPTSEERVAQVMSERPALEFAQNDLVPRRVEVGHHAVPSIAMDDLDAVVARDRVEIGGRASLAGLLERLARPLLDEGRPGQVVHGIRFISERWNRDRASGGAVSWVRTEGTRAATLAAYRVTGTGKGDEWTGGRHRHITTLCLEDRRQVPKATAIAYIESKFETYYTFADGQRANVEVVQRCSRCYAKYLRTDRDTTVKDNLLELPDC